MRYNPFDIPGYREAVQKEGEIRVAAFVSPSTSICGIPIRQMTPMDFINLNGIESPMLYGTDFSRKDITRFLRLLSAKPIKPNWLSNYRFGKRCRRINLDEAKASIDKYLERTFFDSPSTSAGAHVSFASWCAHLIDLIASEYGWPMDDIMRCPFRVLDQLANCIKKRNDPESITFNPLSGKVRQEFTKLRQARLSLVNLLGNRARN